MVVMAQQVCRDREALFTMVDLEAWRADLFVRVADPGFQVVKRMVQSGRQVWRGDPLGCRSFYGAHLVAGA